MAVAPSLISWISSTASARRLRSGVRRELLPQRHRHRVLELGASHLQHATELDRLGGEGVLEDGHRLEQAAHTANTVAVLTAVG
jgi:hypothetical protein